MSTKLGVSVDRGQQGVDGSARDRDLTVSS